VSITTAVPTNLPLGRPRPTSDTATMKRLWAPWRLSYVQDMKQDGCFLCDILKEDDDRQNLLLHRGRLCAMVVNRYPYTNGHLMVFPVRHTADLVELSPEENTEALRLVSFAIRALRETIHPDGFNVGVNIGKAGGAGLEEHVHMHVVPRWGGDTNFITVMDDVRIVPQSLLDLWDVLQPVVSRIAS